MKNKITNLINKKYFHLCMVIIIIAVILFGLGIIILKYNVEGETNMPFDLNKIIIISSSEGIDKESGENKWAFDVNQNNDIFLYIQKNNNYGKEEIIETILVDNINIQKQVNKGNGNLYKPEPDETRSMFNNSENNKIENIEYIGDMESNIKQLKISNQGGIVAFRYSNDKISEYISNDEEINHSELMQKSNITEEELKTKLNFDITIKLKSGKQYKANISLDIPVEGIIEKGTTSTEITNFEGIIFKRIKN
ncbi:MAG: hypothetical protein HFJ40_03765 [Clostridia bacterium]|nr:hypothetical protein [Clostridia bacterium]